MKHVGQNATIQAIASRYEILLCAIFKYFSNVSFFDICTQFRLISDFYETYRYYWPGFCEDATSYEEICDFCRHRDSGGGLVKPAKSILASRPNERWQIDLKLNLAFTWIDETGRIVTKRAHAMNMVDVFSRYLMSRLIPTKHAPVVADAFDRVVLKEGKLCQNFAIRLRNVR